MKKTFMPDFTDTGQLFDHQLQGLKWTINHAYNGSPFYKSQFEKAGVIPGDINSLDDILKLPFTTGNDLKEGYPFPLLSVPQEDVVRIHASSGTTGKRKVLSYTQKDLDTWFDMFARCYEMAGVTEPRQEIHIAEPYDPFDYKVLHHLEGLQLADRGKAVELYLDGTAAPDGDMPVCPSGGLLGVGNPIAAAGLMKIAELFWQLRGEAGDRQVAGSPKRGLAQAWGDLMQVGTVVVMRS